MLFHCREKEEDQMLADMIQRLGKGPFSSSRAAWGSLGLWVSPCSVSAPSPADGSLESHEPERKKNKFRLSKIWKQKKQE